MRVLVIGANGYLGSVVTEHLVQSGHVAIGLVRTPSGGSRLAELGAEVIIADATNHDSVLAAVDSADATILCAQLLLEPERMLVEAVLHRLEGSNRTFIFTSGTGLLSQRTDGEWSEDTYSENDTFAPSKYVGSRHDTERTVLDAAPKGIRTIVVRPAMIWGRGKGPTLEAFYSSAASTGSVCFVGRGLNLYSNVHVDDVADLYLRALDAGVAGALYHAVSGETNFRTIAQAVAKDLGVPTRSIELEEAIQVWGKFTALVIMSVCSRTRAPRSRSELGWEPSRDRSDILDDIGHPHLRDLFARTDRTE